MSVNQFQFNQFAERPRSETPPPGIGDRLASSQIRSSQLRSSPIRQESPALEDFPVSSQLSSASQSRPPRATLEQKIQVLDWHHSHGSTQQHTVSHFHRLGEFGITKSSFNRWVKDERKLRHAYNSMSIEIRSKHKTVPTKKFAGADRCLEKWFEQTLFENQPLMEKEMMKQWFKFQRLYNAGQNVGQADVSGSDDDEANKKSNGWMHHFKKRMKSRKQQIIAFVDDELEHFNDAIDHELKRLNETFDGFEEKDIYHLDEFSITDRVVPVGTQYIKFTIGICTNGDASDIREPLIISHSGEADGCFHSRIGLTSEIFWEYLKKWDEALGGRRVFLILDRLHEHVIAQELRNINILWLDKCVSPLKNVVRWFKLEVKTLLLKHILVEWTNHHRVKSGTTEEFSLMLRQTYERLPSMYNDIRNSWAVSGVIHGLVGAAWNKSSEAEELFAKLLRIAQEKKLVDSIPLSFKDLLFSDDEAVTNRHLSDQEIVAIVKISEQSNAAVKPASASKQQAEKALLAQRVDMTQLRKVDRAITHDLYGFFDKDTSKARFPGSTAAFERFWNEYVRESMDSWLNEQENYNVLPELLNR